jgi:hypothetical protein
MARYRYRSAQRRPARARHPVRLRALRQTGRGHDRQRDHLSRTLGRARSRARCWASTSPRSTSCELAHVGNGNDPNDTPSAVPRGRARRRIRACANFSTGQRQMQDLPRHLGQHSGGMVIARGSSIPWCRSNRPRCRAAWSCSGTKKTAPTWASSKSICWAWDDGGAGRVPGADARITGAKSTWRICRPTIRRFTNALQKADTIGMFQVESRAQMATCRA